MLQWAFYVLVVSALLFAAGALAEIGLRRRHLPTRWAWGITLALSVALGFHALPMPARSAGSTPTSVPQTAPVYQPVVPIRLPTIAATATTGRSTVEMISWEAHFRTLWLGMSSLLLVGLAASAVQVYWRRRRWPMRLLGSHCVGVSTAVGPAVIGLLRPTIVLPEWVFDRSHGEQQLIIAHEASHLQARDPLLLSAALLAILVLPWNLLLWWQLLRLRHAIEVDCDARVLRAGHDTTLYGEALIEVGQRKSRYVGTVAAMSESRTLLEKRIELMTLRNRKPWTLGFAVVAALSLSVAFAATQVSAPDTPGGKEVVVDAATLAHYVGHYKLGPTSILTITRESEQLNAQITGQPKFPIYAQSPAEFYWKVVEAKVTFSGDEHGLASTATIHQNGQDIPAPRVDDSSVKLVENQLSDRITANQPQPGTEAALRKTIAALVAATPNYSDMTEFLQDAVHKQQPVTDAYLGKLGGIQSVEFRGVADNGADKYLVTHQSGKQSQWLIQLGGDGKISTLAMLPIL